MRENQESREASWIHTAKVRESLVRGLERERKAAKNFKMPFGMHFRGYFL